MVCVEILRTFVESSRVLPLIPVQRSPFAFIMKAECEG